MSKFSKLSRAEMKNVLGGITPEMASCEPGAWDYAVIRYDGTCNFTEYNHCLNYCSESYCNVQGKCTINEV